jgi:diguanylate cyclase (GGDEF)-like protein/PAS domain S-box-containing protein
MLNIRSKALMRTTIEPAKLLKHIYDSATYFAIFTTDSVGKVNSWNAGAEIILGFSEDDMLGSDISRIFPPESRAAGDVEREMTIAAETGRATDYRWHLRKDGSRFWADGMMTPIRNDTNETIGYLKILQDITERKVAQDKITQLATMDPLTGLSNRGAFDIKVKEMILLNARSGQSLQLFLIDLDRFKEVNDTLGHPAGDDLLRQVAFRLKAVSRESDFAARLGGDEFGLLQIGPSYSASSSVFASKLVDCLACPFDIGSVSVQISASVGIACSPEDGFNHGELLKKADLALYAVKSAGRNGFHYFTEKLDQIARKRRIDSEALRKVVREKSFWLEYQPILNSSTGRATAMEALVRFPGPILSAYPVDYAIDLAREIGLISEIGAWVFAEGCMQLIKWKQCGIGDLRLCVNTCAKELLDKTYLDSIESTIKRSGVAERDIEIELTERDAIDLKEVGSFVLDTLAGAGFKLALDDFGTGYSSLSYLRSLPVSTIKLDKSFLLDVPAQTSANAVAQAVVSLAKILHLQVVAEGVEDRAQVQFLQKIECTSFQGFLFSKSMKSMPATQWLLANRVATNRSDFFSVY